MKKIGILKLLFVAMVFIVSCSSNDKLMEMAIYHTPQEVTANYAISCVTFDGEFESIIQSKKISDQETLQQFDNLIDGLSNGKETDVEDIRIKVLLRYFDRTDTLCFGEFFGVFLNGNEMTDNPELLLTIKEMIY